MGIDANQPEMEKLIKSVSTTCVKFYWIILQLTQKIYAAKIRIIFLSVT